MSTYAGSWTLDPDRTSITFHTKAMWVLPVKGTFRALEGAGEVGADGSLSGTLVIDAASIDTGNKKRDDHLRNADFLEVTAHPAITFTATGAVATPAGKVEVTGELTVHGRTKPLTLLAEVSATGDSATVSTEVEIDRSLWGLTWAQMGAGLKNRAVVTAHFHRP
ncbi:YceI family protein [Peterkaempfera bronchialis]|uniref:YceI family protein n=1 Tax=Peterkaempfera bronchialis TaxID=2126346 RepID=UPI001E50C147|nr:YceI family protein [Peterkaempfera bronchialis]